MAPGLVTLPRELLWEVLDHLHSLRELHSLLLTSKDLYQACNGAPRKTVSALASHSAELRLLEGLGPYPHLFLAASARNLADWAIQSEKRRKMLKFALHGGIWSLFELAMDKAPIALDEIREIWRWKQDALEPVSWVLGQTCGPKAWPYPQLSLLLWVIYGELFHHTFSFVYENYHRLSRNSPPLPQPLDCVTRFKFLVYCAPDTKSFKLLGIREKDLHSRLRLFMERTPIDICQQSTMENACVNYLRPKAWADALRFYIQIRPHPRDLFSSPEKVGDLLYVSTVMHWGKRSLEILVEGGPEKYAAELKQLKSKIRNVTASEDTFLKTFPYLPRDIVDWTKDTRGQLTISPWIMLSEDLRITLKGLFASNEEQLRHWYRINRANVDDLEGLLDLKEFWRLVDDIRTPPDLNQDEDEVEA
ncbi:hypothetical protein VTN77DRAFT_7770 [Rasamsonia byssochlamydoides]|uniref:uncharacterized protein n=1 Tax=Rasamsonia byssochlamydoides TaxID=89139 RepID=UPI0037421F5D